MLKFPRFIAGDKLNGMCNLEPEYKSGIARYNRKKYTEHLLEPGDDNIQNEKPTWRR